MQINLYWARFRVLIFYVLSILLIGLNGKVCHFAYGHLELTPNSTIQLPQPLHKERYHISVRHRLWRSGRRWVKLCQILDLVLTTIWSRRCIIHEYRRPHFCCIRRQPQHLRRNSSDLWYDLVPSSGHRLINIALRARCCETSTSYLYLDHEKRHSNPRSCFNQQCQHALFRKQLHWKRSSLGMAKKSHRCIRPDCMVVYRHHELAIP